MDMENFKFKEGDILAVDKDYAENKYHKIMGLKNSSIGGW